MRVIVDGVVTINHPPIANSGADQTGISRNYGDIHYLISINTGLQMAKDIGNRVGDIKLHE